MRFDTGRRLDDATLKRLARLIEVDLRDMPTFDINDVQRILEEGSRQGDKLYRAAAEGSDSQAKRLVKEIKSIRQERVDANHILFSKM